MSATAKPQTAKPLPPAKGARSVSEGSSRREATINLRISTQTRDLIDTAAEVAGKSRTDFVLESARQHAVDVLLDQTLFHLDEASYATFLEKLDHRPEPNEALEALFRKKAPWEG